MISEGRKTRWWALTPNAQWKQWYHSERNRKDDYDEAELGDSDSDHRSQNHRMAGGGRGLAQPLPKQGQQNRVPSPTYRKLLKISKKETTQPLGSLCSINCTAQKCCLVFRKYCLCCNLCPLALLLALDTIDQRLALSSAPSPWVLTGIDEIPFTPL